MTETACLLLQAFVSALARWTTPHQESGSPSPHFYSFETGMVHVIGVHSCCLLACRSSDCGGCHTNFMQQHSTVLAKLPVLLRVGNAPEWL